MKRALGNHVRSRRKSLDGAASLFWKACRGGVGSAGEQNEFEPLVAETRTRKHKKNKKRIMSAPSTRDIAFATYTPLADTVDESPLGTL